MFAMRGRWCAGPGSWVRCGARLSGERGRCRAWALKGRRRCKWHGGKSTGPRDWRASVAAMVAGRKRYIERRHEMGLKAPGGRLPSLANALRQMEQAIEIADAAIAVIERRIAAETERPADG